MPNRLASETSPYLLQHKDNPIDWYPWGEEAFSKAYAEQKPVFLSVGYSSCHWCHVMAHESFESHEVARLLNEHFVSVKVDREERPDVDETYMAAVHLTNGRGGWPMTVFLTPGKKPFFAGTYFPKHDRGGQPGLLSILEQVAKGWVAKRPEFENVASQYGEAMQNLLGRGAPFAAVALSMETVRNAVRALIAEADLEHGGFGGKPKFPPHTAVAFLLAFAERANDSGNDDESLRGSALAVALNALDHMAMGGIRDHVGGGFHRYSTDERWLLPHFEKMLYDNALMLGNYAQACEAVAGKDAEFLALAGDTAGGIVDWLDREMASPDGLFYSALDADSEGEEGRFYVWTDAEVRDALGDDASPFLTAYGFEKEGNFAEEATGRRTGANIPHLQDASTGFQGSLAKLREVRNRRVRPGTDSKVLVGWNGLAIGALATSGHREPAVRAADAILAAEKKAGTLPRQIVDGEPVGSAFLEDYAYLALGLLQLAECPGEGGRRSAAERLMDEAVERFWDAANGGFFATDGKHEELFGRTKPVFDQPIPSANSAAIRCLVRLGRLEPARESLDAFLGWMETAPQNCEGLLLAALEYLEACGDANSPVQSGGQRRDVKVGLAEETLRAAQDGWASGEVVMVIPDGMHVNPYEPVAKWLIRTEVVVTPLEAQISYPESSEMGYVGETHIPFKVRLPKGEPSANIEVTIRYQACTETECLAPAEIRIAASVQHPE